MTMPNKTWLDDKWIKDIDGKLTFAGALESFFEEICHRKYWRAESTRTQYIRDYDRRIIPNLTDHDLKPLEEYTQEDYQECVKRISENTNYSEETLQHFRNLIEAVVETASINRICENVLWGSVFALEKMVSSRDKVKELVTLKKSLTPKQEMKIADLVLRNEKEAGPRVGVALMFSMGLRNGEACAATFGDIVKLPEVDDLHVLMIYKTVESRNYKLVSSGKTKNADRFLPLPNTLYEFLEKRKKFIMSITSCTEEEVKTYPIACSVKGYEVRCIPDEITAAGKNVFREIGVAGEVLSYIDAEIEEGEDPVLVKEKDPTSYLFRRNFATYLHVLELTDTEIHYLMGHDIEDTYETRNEMYDPIRLSIMQKKLNHRCFFFRNSNQLHLAVEKYEKQYKFGVQEPSEIVIQAKKGEVSIAVEAIEEMDNVQFEIVQSEEIFVQKKRTYQSDPDYPTDRTVCIMRDYLKTARQK